MNKINSIKNKVNKIFVCSIYILFLIPILPQFLKITSVGFFLFCSSLSLIVSKSAFRWKFFTINASLYLLYLISLIYSSDLSYAFSKLEVSSSIILFPLGFAMASNESRELVKKNIKPLMYTYIFSVLFLNIYLLGTFLIEMDKLYSFIGYADFINNLKSMPQMHSLYLGIHNSVAILMVFYLLKTERFLKTGGFLYILGFLLGVGLILLLKKGPTFGLIFVATLLCLKYKLKRVWAFYFVFVCSLASFFIMFPDQINYFNQLLKIEKTAKHKSSSEIQNAVLNCSNKNIKEAGLFGFGIGDAKNEIIDCYSKIDQDLAASSYNTHNQYMSVILMVGWFGLIIFLIVIFLNLNLAIKSNMFISVAILLLYMIAMLSENILERQEGVIYFSLFFNFFYFMAYRVNKKPLTLNENQARIYVD